MILQTELLIGQYFDLTETEIEELDEEEFATYAAKALYLEKRQTEAMTHAINKGVGLLFGN